MYHQQPYPAEQDIVQHIFNDFAFPVPNQFGEASLALSRDIGSLEAIQNMIQVNDFVEQNAKSKQPAVKFDTTIYGTRGISPRKKSNAGRPRQCESADVPD